MYQVRYRYQVRIGVGKSVKWAIPVSRQRDSTAFYRRVDMPRVDRVRLAWHVIQTPVAGSQSRRSRVPGTNLSKCCSKLCVQKHGIAVQNQLPAGLFGLWRWPQGSARRGEERRAETVVKALRSLPARRLRGKERRLKAKAVLGLLAAPVSVAYRAAILSGATGPAAPGVMAASVRTLFNPSCRSTVPPPASATASRGPATPVLAPRLRPCVIPARRSIRTASTLTERVIEGVSEYFPEGTVDRVQHSVEFLCADREFVKEWDSGKQVCCH